MNTINRKMGIVSHDLEHKHIVFIDEDTNVLSSYKIDRALDIQKLDNGNILASLGPSGKIAEYDKNGDIVFELDAKSLWDAPNLPWISGICKVGDNTIFADFTNDAIFELDNNLNIVGKLIEPQIFKCPASIVLL